MKCVLLLPLFFLQSCLANFTDFSKCKVHYSVQEKKYKTFYRFDEQQNLSKNNDTILDFHFSVLGISDAHILLATSANVKYTDPVYEIVIGAGGNTFCDIRKRQKSDVRATYRVKGLLSGLDVRSFWIRIFKDGAIDVGKEGEELGFISYKDTDLLPVEVFSFSTWDNVEAKWFFDCPRGDKSTNSKEIVLTDLDKLRRDLLTGYDPYVRPVEDDDTISYVIFRFYSYFITLDEKKSVLNMKGKVLVEWEDEKLIWDPDMYGNIKYMHFYHGEIWKPHVIIANGVNPNDADALHSRLLVVFSNGTVRWKVSLDSYTFCDISGLYHWPNDIHSCGIIFSLWYEYRQHLFYDNSQSGVLRTNYQNGWEILETTALPTNPQENTTHNDSPSLFLNIKIRRISDLYGKTLFTPFFVTSTLMLLSFWVSPFGPLKISLLCAQLILVCMILIGISLCIPGHPKQVPFLVYLYSFAVIQNILSILIGVIVINICRKEHTYALPHSQAKILNFKFVKALLLLPEGELGTDYGKLDAQKTFKNVTVQEMWIRSATAIDRIAFFFFLCTTISAFFLKY